ncbi:MAG TPA: tetraacyldisaccharide 4'-kinase [Pirellulales bacterium]
MTSSEPLRTDPPAPSREETFRRIVSGEQRGLGATLARLGLSLVEPLYAATMSLRNAAYSRGWKRVTKVDVPVVSVGNVPLGGTGKTPFVAWLAQRLRERDVRVSIVSRGYGAGQRGANDEALVLERRLPDVPHVQDRDRIVAAQIAIEELETQLILLDDGFQHRRLARDLDLVLIDALDPFGGARVFPRGLLRESLSGLGRASAVVLTRADLVDASTRESIRRTVERYSPNVPWIESRFTPTALVNSLGEERPIDSLAGQAVAAFCGIGNPAGFRRTLASLGHDPIEFLTFPDHHDFARPDVERLVRWATEQQRAKSCSAVLCTEKDLVKLDLDRLGPLPLWAVRIDCEIVSGADALDALLAPLA